MIYCSLLCAVTLLEHMFCSVLQGGPQEEALEFEDDTGVGGGAWQCEGCDRLITMPYQLHQLLYHTVHDRAYHCDMCGSLDVTDTGIVAHIKMAHGRHIDTLTAQSLRKKTDSQFTRLMGCKKCKFRHYQLSVMQRHYKGGCNVWAVEVAFNKAHRQQKIPIPKFNRPHPRPRRPQPPAARRHKKSGNNNKPFASRAPETVTSHEPAQMQLEGVRPRRPQSPLLYSPPITPTMLPRCSPEIDTIALHMAPINAPRPRPVAFQPVTTPVQATDMIDGNILRLQAYRLLVTQPERERTFQHLTPIDQWRDTARAGHKVACYGKIMETSSSTLRSSCFFDQLFPAGTYLVRDTTQSPVCSFNVSYSSAHRLGTEEEDQENWPHPSFAVADLIEVNNIGSDMLVGFVRFDAPAADGAYLVYDLENNVFPIGTVSFSHLGLNPFGTQ